MANTFVNLTADIIAQKSLTLMQPNLAQLKTLSIDFSSEVASAGETVKTRLAGAVTSSTWDATNKYQSQNATTSGVQVTLGDPSYSQLEFTPKEVATIGFDRLVTLFMEPLSYAVVKSMQTDLLSKVVSDSGVLDANALALASISSFDRSKVIELNKKMSNNALPEEGRVQHLGPDAYYALITDNTVAQAFSIGGNEVIRNGRIGRLHGNDFYEVQSIGAQVYKAGATPVLLKGIAGNKEGFMIASRAPAVSAGTNADVAIATDPATGFTFMVSKWFNVDEGKHKIRAEWLFGTALAQKKCIYPIVQGTL